MAGSGDGAGATAVKPVVGGGGDWLQIYFTHSDPPDNTKNGIDQYIIAVLEQAKKAIDVASFDFNLPSVTNALVEASQRGVKVRVVMDEENGAQVLNISGSPAGKDFDALKTLNAAGIPVVNGGRSDGLMHDKMILVDGNTLFMGSWNISYNDTFRNNNNLLQITAPDLIANYQAKFNEMFQDQRFGTRAQVGALKPSLNIDGIRVENFFSPVDGVMDKLLRHVQSARKSIHFMAFAYTDQNLARAMIGRFKAGVEVKGVIETRNASEGAFGTLFCARLPVLEDGNHYTMHHKVMIIDRQFVITGSFNFTKAADDVNDDNVIVIHDPAIAALYEQEFDTVYSIGREPSGGEFPCQ